MERSIAGGDFEERWCIWCGKTYTPSDGDYGFCPVHRSYTLVSILAQAAEQEEEPSTLKVRWVIDPTEWHLH